MIRWSRHSTTLMSTALLVFALVQAWPALGICGCDTVAPAGCCTAPDPVPDACCAEPTAAAPAHCSDAVSIPDGPSIAATACARTAASVLATPVVITKADPHRPGPAAPVPLPLNEDQLRSQNSSSIRAAGPGAVTPLRSIVLWTSSFLL